MTDTPTKINANRQKKMDIVADLSGKFEKAKAVVFTNYQGLTHKQIEGLKKELKKADSEFVVAKNSLLTRAIDEKHKLEGEHELGGQTGTLFLYEDVISPLKALAKLIKELNLPNVRFGIMDGAFITGEQILKLSTLPTREVLLAQLTFTLKSPISGLHRAMNWNLQKLVMSLNAVAKAKPADSAPVQPVAEPVTEPVTNEQVAPTQPVAEPVSQKELQSQPEPETILAETAEEKALEQPTEPEKPAESLENQSSNENKGGEN